MRGGLLPTLRAAQSFGLRKRIDQHFPSVQFIAQSGTVGPTMIASRTGRYLVMVYLLEIFIDMILIGLQYS